VAHGGMDRRLIFDIRYKLLSAFDVSYSMIVVCRDIIVVVVE